jgi:aminomethyltransferase
MLWTWNMTLSANQPQKTLQYTPLHTLHASLGAKMVPFAGYDMPVSYGLGILKEHLHTRAAAGLFDVSHMGQMHVAGADWHATASALEALVPADVLNLKPGAQRYSQLLNDSGGIIDDLMIARPAEDDVVFLVVNAARKIADQAHIAEHLPSGVSLHWLEDKALLALQGPAAASVLSRHAPEAVRLTFMTVLRTQFDGTACHISRSGYTGEDGFEISVDAQHAEAVARALLAEPEVLPIGLGARDTLRLEAGLCLYGHDIDETSSPIEAALGWSVSKRRCRMGGFPGADRIAHDLNNGPRRRRAGFLLEGRSAAREGSDIFDEDAQLIGQVTSGAFSPSLNQAIAMGYVLPEFAKPGTTVSLIIRGKPVPAKTVPLPFVPHAYLR